MSVSRSASAVLFLLLILVVTEMGPMTVAGARTCFTPSSSFHGVCLSDTDCRIVCRTENFPDGDCKTVGLNRKCFCVEDCP